MHRMIVFLLAGLFVFSSGCLDYSEKLVLKSNGSGSMSVRFAIDKEARVEAENMANSMASAFGDMGGVQQEMEDPFAAFDEDRIRARLKEKGSNAKLKSYKQYEKGGDEVTEMEVTFSGSDDLGDLAYALSDNEEKSSEVPFSYSKGSDGLWHFSRSHENSGSDFSMGDAPPGGPGGMPNMGGGQETPNIPGLPGGIDPSKIAEMSDSEREEMVADMMKGLQENISQMQSSMGVKGDGDDREVSFDQMKAKMEESMAGRKIHFEVHFPGKVVDSNATSVNGKVAVWEYALTDVQHQSMPDEFHATVKH